MIRRSNGSSIASAIMFASPLKLLHQAMDLTEFGTGALIGASVSALAISKSLRV